MLELRDRKRKTGSKTLEAELQKYEYARPQSQPDQSRRYLPAHLTQVETRPGPDLCSVIILHLKQYILPMPNLHQAVRLKG